MERISIISLIYQSIEYAEFLYDNIRRHTPELGTWDAEFFFVANDATPEVLAFLKEKKYPHYININPVYSDEDRFDKGFGFPEYMGRVYMGYNYGMRMARSPIITLVSSDNCFSPHWLHNLKKRLTHANVVSPRMIQPCWFMNPTNGSECEIIDFGTGVKSFQDVAFQERVKEIREDSTSIGNAFMPLMIYKDNARLVGYYPLGNLHDGDYNKIKSFGDQEFYKRLAELGIEHITSNDSIIYHFNEGEKYLKVE